MILRHFYACQKWLTVAGLLIMLAPLCSTWYWGNTVVYVNSYLLQRVEANNSGVLTPWTMSSFDVGCSLGLWVGGGLWQKFESKWVMLVAIVVQSSGFAVSYFTIKESAILVKTVFGTLGGFGFNFIAGLSLKIILNWSQNDFGLINSIVYSGFTVGAIFVNQLVTLFINVDNLSPNYKFGPAIFFSQNEVLDRVPYIFLILALVILITFILGVPFVKIKPEINIENNFYSSKNALIKSECMSTEKNGECTSSFCGYEPIVICNDRSDIQYHDNGNAPMLDMSPMKSIRTLSFHCLSYMTFAGIANMVVIPSYCKTYMQLFIQDDHLVTNTSITFLIVLSISRIIWGWVLDKLGPKSTFMLYFSTTGLAILAFYFSALINKWLNIVCLHILVAAMNPIYIISANALAKTFGQKHLILNYALCESIGAVLSLGLSVLCQKVLFEFGWFYLFTGLTGLNLTSMVVTWLM